MSAELLIALLTLTLMEIVLGIDNVIFIAIIAGRLPKKDQDKARKIGLMVALITRLMLLGLLFVLSHLDKVIVFSWNSLGVPSSWVSPEVDNVSIKDLVLLLGGLFLIAKSTMEIHHKLEGAEETSGPVQSASFTSIILQIAVLDVVFSLDSVITAVGMVKAKSSTDWPALAVMVVAMVIALIVMLLFSGMISDFVSRHPTIKILALAFLILIGVMLVVEGTGKHIDKGYIYFAMAFSVAVEMINMRIRSRSSPVALHEPKATGQ
ncbi:MAG: TerC family protein [Gemmataceae bacterium]